MKPNQPYLIEPSESGSGGFVLTGEVARIRRTSDRAIAGAIHRSWRNAPNAAPGVPVWWFSPADPPRPVEATDTSEADAIAKALAWLAIHDAPRRETKPRHPQPRPSKTSR